MKVAISSQGSDLSSPLDARFGRAKNFIVVDTETDQLTVHDNTQNQNATQGAGIQAARALADLNVGAVITGHVGPKAYTALRAGNVDVYTGASGTVKDALDKLKAGQLQAADQANVQGHWT